MKLSDIQQSFLDSVFEENKSLDFILPTHSNHEDTIKIYKDTIDAQLINTLKIVFPICESMLGEDFFSAMAYQYIKDYPSQSSNLNEYGKHMPIFMKSFNPLEDYPYFSDIAVMEYNYDEISRVPFTNIEDKDLSNFDESQYNSLIFKPVESLRLFSSLNKVAQIWKMYKDDDIKEINIYGETTYYMIYKVYYQAHVIEITYDEYEFLNASKQDLCLEEIVEKYPTIIDNLGNVIASILQNKVIQDILIK